MYRLDAAKKYVACESQAVATLGRVFPVSKERELGRGVEQRMVFGVFRTFERLAREQRGRSAEHVVFAMQTQ